MVFWCHLRNKFLEPMEIASMEIEEPGMKFDGTERDSGKGVFVLIVVVITITLQNELIVCAFVKMTEFVTVNLITLLYTLGAILERSRG